MICPNPDTLVCYVDGELPPGQRAEVEAHLATCAACHGGVAEYRGLNIAGRAALAAITVTAPRSLPIARARAFPIRAALVAAMLLVTVSVAAVLLTRGQRNRGVATAPDTPGPVATRPTTTTAPGTLDPAAMDAAFERWAAEHRRKRIPLVPMEEVANWEPPTLLPYRGK